MEEFWTINESRFAINEECTHTVEQNCADTIKINSSSAVSAEDAWVYKEILGSATSSSGTTNDNIKWRNERHHENI